MAPAAREQHVRQQCQFDDSPFSSLKFKSANNATAPTHWPRQPIVSPRGAYTLAASAD
jgi:hypothetical protein